MIIAALWQWAAPVMYWTLEITQGGKALDVGLELLFERLKLWLRVVFVTSIFFYTSLTAIKVSFLLFFRKLGDRVPRFNLYWWPVFLFVLATWIVGIGTTAKESECILPKDMQTLFFTCQAPAETSYDVAVLKAMCALDVTSDFLSKSLRVHLSFPISIS